MILPRDFFFLLQNKTLIGLTYYPLMLNSHGEEMVVRNIMFLFSNSFSTVKEVISVAGCKEITEDVSSW